MESKINIVKEFQIHEIDKLHGKTKKSYLKNKSNAAELCYSILKIGKDSRGQYYNWIKCDKDHEFWQFASHAGKHKCADCKGVKLQTLEQILARLEPLGITLLEDYKGMTQTHQLQCSKCSHKWETTLHSVLNSHATGCPKCNTNSSKIQNRIYAELLTILPSAEIEARRTVDNHTLDLDIYIPSELICLEIDCYKSHDGNPHDFRKNRALEDLGIQVIRYRDSKFNPIAITDFNPSSTKGDKFTDIANFFIHLAQYVKDDAIASQLRAYKNNGKFINNEKYQELRSITRIPPLEKSFKFNRPKCSMLWDFEKNGYLKPEDIGTFSNREIHLICSNSNCKHSYKTRACYKKSDATECGECYNQGVNSTNSVAGVLPDLAKQWDYQKNAPLTPNDVRWGCSYKIWWICSSCGQSWNSTQANRRRFRKARCPNKKCGKIETP